MRLDRSDNMHSGRPDAVIEGVSRSTCQSGLSRPLASDGLCSIGQHPRSHASPSSKQRPPCHCPITSSPHLLDAPSDSCPSPRGLWLLASNERAGQRETWGPAYLDRSRTRELPAMALPACGGPEGDARLRAGLSLRHEAVPLVVTWTSTSDKQRGGSCSYSRGLPH